jgi:prolyl oligopeptidase PreP (S9A serine peptidase family)
MVSKFFMRRAFGFAKTLGLEILAAILLTFLAIRLFYGDRMSKVASDFIHRLFKKGDSDDDDDNNVDNEKSSVGLTSKFLYPLIMNDKNQPFKSVPYTMFDSKIIDDFQWLEEENASKCKKWLKRQSECTKRILKRDMSMSTSSSYAFYDKIVSSIKLTKNTYVAIDNVFQKGSRTFIAATLMNSCGLNEHGNKSNARLYVTNSDSVIGDTFTAIASKFNNDNDSTKAKPQDSIRIDTHSSSFLVISTEEIATNLVCQWICNEGMIMAYMITKSKEDGDINSRSESNTWGEIKVRNITTDTNNKNDTTDFLANGIHVTNTSVAWLHNELGFFYTKLELCSNNEKSNDSHLSGAGYVHVIMFHILGTSQDDDICILRSLKPLQNELGEFYSLDISVDGNYLLINSYQENSQDFLLSQVTNETLNTRSNNFYYININTVLHASGKNDDVSNTNTKLESDSNLKDVISKLTVYKLIETNTEFVWNYIANVQGKFWFRTNFGADNYRIVSLSIPSSNSIKEAYQLSNNSPRKQNKNDDDNNSGNTYHARLLALMKETWQISEECIPEDICYLEKASVASQSVLVLKYRRRQNNEVTLYDLHSGSTSNGVINTAVELPKNQCDVIDGPFCNFYSSSIFYKTTNFADPGCIWRARVSRDTKSQIFLSFEPLYIPNIIESVGDGDVYDMHDYETFEEEFKFGQIKTLEQIKCRSSISPNSSNGSINGSFLGSGSINNTIASTGTGGVMQNEVMHMQLFSCRKRDSQGFIIDSPISPNQKRKSQAQGPSPRQGKGRRVSALSSSEENLKDMLSNNSDLANEGSSRPCILYVYGSCSNNNGSATGNSDGNGDSSFDMSFTPSFSPILCSFVKHYNAIIAVLKVDMSDCTTINGNNNITGNDYNYNYDRAATCVLAATEHLIKSNIASSCNNGRIGLFAGTYGATICSIALNRRPDLFGCAVLQNGLYDLLRINKLNPPVKWIHNEDDQNMDVDCAWDYVLGNAESSSEECQELLNISPLHNIRAFWVKDDELCYPAMLIQASTSSSSTSSSSDVNISHSMKYSAQLQRTWGANDRADNPILIDIIDTDNNIDVELQTARALCYLATYCHAEYKD